MKDMSNVKKIKLTDNGCVNLVTAMMFNISRNIKSPHRIMRIAYDKNIINYLNNMKEWIKRDDLWITNWCEIYDFDEYKVKEALINKVEKRLKDYRYQIDG